MPLTTCTRCNGWSCGTTTCRLYTTSWWSLSSTPWYTSISIVRDLPRTDLERPLCFAGNPLVCDCEMRWYKRWYNDGWQVRVRIFLLCSRWSMCRIIDCLTISQWQSLIYVITLIYWRMTALSLDSWTFSFVDILVDGDWIITEKSLSTHCIFYHFEKMQKYR